MEGQFDFDKMCWKRIFINGFTHFFRVKIMVSNYAHVNFGLFLLVAPLSLPHPSGQSRLAYGHHRRVAGGQAFGSRPSQSYNVLPFLPLAAMIGGPIKRQSQIL